MPKEQWEEPFERFFAQMRNRMVVSGHKYGEVYASYPAKVDALACADQRVALYRKTHNTEALLDAANFLLIEAMAPRFKDAHFEGTDSDQSPGLVRHRPVSQSAVAAIRAMKE